MCFCMPEPESLFRTEASPTSFKPFRNQPTTWPHQEAASQVIFAYSAQLPF